MTNSYSLKGKLSKHIYKILLKRGIFNDLFNHQMNIKDSLTGVATLTHAIEVGQDMLDNGLNISTLVIGLDNFKQFNDTYGLLSANNILINFGQRLQLKTANLNCLVGRLGGDVFVVIIKNDSYTEKNNICEVLFDSLKEELYQIETNIEPLKVGFSIGEAISVNRTSSSIQKLIQEAEANMEYNKYKSRSTITDIDQSNNILHTQANQLLKVLAEKDMYTYVHSQYTSKYAVALAESMDLSDDMIEKICLAGWLHDIGKIIITSDILRKPTKLEQDEYSIIQQHVLNGLNIMGTYDFSELVNNAIQYHHERWDGKGYPNGVSGKDTPIEGRILQITDAFSAMTIKRVYRDKLSLDDAIEEIERNSGTQFDPQLASKFIELLKGMKVAM